MRAVTTVLACLLALGTLLLQGGVASGNALAGNGYSSSYSGESVFEDRAAGQSAQFSAIFFNDGTQPWLQGVVGLLVCLPDKVTCNVPSPNAQYASGWLSSTVYATVTSTVSPGQNGFFVYNVTVPAGTPGNTVATFNGDVGIIATGTELHPEGYYQQNTTPPVLGTLTVSPTSASLPVGGQQQFTATTSLTGAVRWAVNGTCGGIDQNGTFTAVSTTSQALPCSVVASAGGLSASATISVFGSPASLSCSATPTSLVANGGVAPNGQSTVTVAVNDASGNLVSNSSLGVVVTNSSTTLATVTPVGGAVTAANGVATVTVSSTLRTGSVGLSLTAALPVTGCSVLLASVPAGAPSQLLATVSPTTIGADGVSTATLRVDVQDAMGDRTLDAATTVDVQIVGDTRVCTLTGVITGAGSASGAAGSGNDIDGRIEFSVKSTFIEGTCSFRATARGAPLAASSAALTTRFVGQAVKLAVVGNDSPHAAGSASRTSVTLAVLDGAGTQVSSSTLAITAALAGNCTGAGGGDVSMSAPGATSGGQAVFQFTSNGAYSGCLLVFTATGASATQASIAFAAGAADHLGCAFVPSSIGVSSSGAALVTVQDQLGNTVAAGSYSVSLSRTGGDGVTQGTAARPQTTTAGFASFPVRSAAAPGADIYTPTLLGGTLARVIPDRTCTISVTR